MYSLKEMEQLILDGKEKADIQGDLTDSEYNNCLNKILSKYGKVDGILLRIEYINNIERLFFASKDLFDQTHGAEKLFWRDRMNHLGSIYATYKALKPYKENN